LKLTIIAPEAGEIDIAGFEGLRNHFANRYWATPSMLLNFVSTTDGRFVGETRSSRDISNEIDYQSLIGYRMAADGILTSAGTARAESYRRSKFAPLALISRGGDFSGIPAVEQDTAGPTNSRVYLLVRWNRVTATKRRYNQPWVTVRAVGTGSSFFVRLTLAQLGWRKILVEAGPAFANWLLVRHMIRGLALTIVGFKGGEPLEACAAALEGLGISGGALESAEVVDQTLLSRWSDLSAKPLKSA
jgi:riboflavin biosynthesis pyrimidine reductase